MLNTNCAIWTRTTLLSYTKKSLRGKSYGSRVGEFSDDGSAQTCPRGITLKGPDENTRPLVLRSVLRPLLPLSALQAKVPYLGVRSMQRLVWPR